MLKDIQPGLYRTSEGGAVQIHKVGRDEGTGRHMAFGLLSRKRGKPIDESWDASTGAHLSKPKYNLAERVATIGDSTHA